MKKILSIVLLLSLCLGLLAGCGQSNSEAVNNLPNAKALVFNTYKPASKDEIPVKSTDFEVMTSVLVDGENFPVEWAVEVTSGDKDAVKIVDGSSAAYKKVDVTEKPESEVQFTLTATIKDTKGNSETVSFKYMTPAFEAPTASKIVICNVADAVYTTGVEYQYTSSSGSVKMELELTDDKAKALPLTLVNNDDGTVSFVTDDSKYLFCDATHVEFAAEASDFTKFILDAADGGYYIKCAVANYNDKPQYLEVYSGYLTCYGMNESKAGMYIFALEDASGATGTVVEFAGSTEPVEPSPEPDNSNDPAADSTLSVADAIALGASKPHNTYTDNKYYVTGVITEVYNEEYGNMKIADKNGNILTVYGTYDADGTNRYDAMATKPVAGDTVTVYGIIGQYKDTPQIKNGWITAHTAGSSDAPKPSPEPEKPASNDPAADSTLSVADAIALGASKEHNTYTEGKYYVSGVITEVYNEQYGNMKIADKNGNVLTVYGTYSADGSTRYDAMATKPVAGDTITVYGIIGQYNDTPQIKNGWITAHTAANPATPEPSPEPEKPASGDPAADSTLSVADAIALGASKEHNTYTEGKYYVTGVITEVYNDQYGNMKIADKNGNVLTVYGTYSADGSTRYDSMAAKPVAGDTITVYGIIGQYNDTPQIKNGWITAHTAVNPSTPEPSPEPSAAPGTSSVTSGQKVKLYCVAGQNYVTTNATEYKGAGRLLPGAEAEAAVFTVEIDENGYYIFSVDGKYLTSAESGSGISLEDTLTDCGRWKVIACGDGIRLENVGANYKGKYNQGLEYYAKNFTTYGFKDADAKIFTFQFVVVE